MPTPRIDESRDSFLARCIPIVLEDGTAESNDQAVAVCHSLWAEGVQENDQMSQAKEHKVLPSIVTKIEQDQGIVEHTVAVMGNVDLGGDRIHPGAFVKTITERAGQIRVLDTHNSDSLMNVIGKSLSLWEVGKGQLPSDVQSAYPDATGALMARTQFLMDTPEGQGAFVRIRDGAVGEYSIGYDPLDVDFTTEMVDEKEVAVRNLRTIRLWEYSPVAFAMNPATSTLSAKEADPDPARYIGAEDEEDVSTTPPISDHDVALDSQATQDKITLNPGVIKDIFNHIETYVREAGQEKGSVSGAMVLADLDLLKSLTEEVKVGRAISAANATRIRSALQGAISALADLEALIGDSKPAQEQDEQSIEAPATEQAALNQQEQEAGPPDQAPTDNVKLEDIEQWIKEIQTELSEETT